MAHRDVSVHQETSVRLQRFSETATQFAQQVSRAVAHTNHQAVLIPIQVCCITSAVQRILGLTKRIGTLHGIVSGFEPQPCAYLPRAALALYLRALYYLFMAM